MSSHTALSMTSRSFEEAVEAFGECGKPSNWGDGYPCNLYWGHSGEHVIRIPDLGWTCGGCFKSGSYMDEFRQHSCGPVAWNNALFALAMSMTFAFIVFMAVR